jgi:hypothetical protein
MDEIEAYRAIGKLRVMIQELESVQLQNVLDTMLDVIAAAHERITDLTDAEDNDE